LPCICCKHSLSIHFYATSPYRTLPLPKGRTLDDGMSRCQ
jgi:hypothetical protein